MSQVKNQLKSDRLRQETGIAYGSDQAPVKLHEFFNVACPYCKKWFEEKNAILEPFVQAGKLQRIFKPFNKEKASLAAGNLLHAQLNFNDGDQAFAQLAYIYEHFHTWKAMDSQADLQAFAQTIPYAAAASSSNQAALQAILIEAEETGTFFVPTVFMNHHVFDENISQETLQAWIEDSLSQ